MIYDFYSRKIKVFVSEVPENLVDLRHHLVKVLQRAGMDVLQTESRKISDSETFISKNKQMLYASDCSVHILEQFQLNHDFSDRSFPVSEFQLQEARARIGSEWRDFKIFAWQPEDFTGTNKRVYSQHEGINRKGILQNMVLSNRNSAIAFVEDIRSVMYKSKPFELDVEQADLFFVYNSIDQDSASEIIYLISDIINIKQLEIIISAQVEYADLIAQQVAKSKMVVIYYKNTIDWAIPFVQQVWKNVGGASSPVPILFIGDADIEKNRKSKTEIPRVVSLLVPHEFMPVEIKVHFDKLVD